MKMGLPLNPRAPLPCVVRVLNLPQVEFAQIRELVTLVVETNIGAVQLEFAADGDDVLVTLAWDVAFRLVDLLNGYLWYNQTLEARLVAGHYPPPFRWVEPWFYSLPVLPKDEEPVSAALTPGTGYQRPAYIVVRNEDTKEMIKVNPCRVYVGNVPFTLLWQQLRNYLVAELEREPGFAVQITRVEIPMNTLRLRSFGYDDDVDSHPMPRLRGFAIVTTANQELAERLIARFDQAEFDGRILTVRFDRFPDICHPVVQQIKPKHYDYPPVYYPGFPMYFHQVVPSQQHYGWYHIPTVPAPTDKRRLGSDGPEVSRVRQFGDLVI